MQIELIDINLINEYENNVKIHTDEQIFKSTETTTR